MSETGEPIKRRHGERVSFLWLLVALLLIFLVDPIFGRSRLGDLAMSVTFSLILFAGVYAVSSRRWVLLVASALAAPAVALDWIVALGGAAILTEFARCLQIACLALTTVVLLIYIAKALRITANLIYGSACVYLLLGILWGVVYIIVASNQTGAFAPEAKDPTDELLYYSFTTLTTLGLGDVTPRSRLARALTSLEAVAGQLYLAVVVAKVVGIYVGQALRARTSAPRDGDEA